VFPAVLKAPSGDAAILTRASSTRAVSYRHTCGHLEIALAARIERVAADTLAPHASVYTPTTRECLHTLLYSRKLEMNKNFPNPSQTVAAGGRPVSRIIFVRNYILSHNRRGNF